MKKLVLISTMFLALVVNVFAGENEPNAKSLKTFNEIFTAAENVKWHNVRSYSEASFVLNGTITKAVIDSQGNLLRTMRYYGGNNLPAHIAFNVKKAFNDKNVWGVTEISDKSGITYSVVLNDNKKWYYVESDADGKLTIVKKFNRS